MKPRTRFRSAGGVVLLVSAALLATQLSWVVSHRALLRPMSSGDIGPELSLPQVDESGRLVGPGVSLSSQRGQVVLLDFWATWCGPCRASMPHLRALYNRFHGEGFALLSINTDDPAKARLFATEQGLEFPLLFDSQGEVASAYRVQSIPHLVLIDRAGIVRRVYRGGRSAADLEHDIARLLNEP